MYQEKTKKTCTINRPIQHLVPLEVANVNRTILDEEHDEPAGETFPRRQAAKSANIIRKLETTRCVVVIHEVSRGGNVAISLQFFVNLSYGF